MTWESDNGTPLLQTEMAQDLVISPWFGSFHSWLESFSCLNSATSWQLKIQQNTVYLFTSAAVLLKWNLSSTWSRAPDKWNDNWCLCLVIYFVSFKRHNRELFLPLWLSGANIWATTARQCLWNSLVCEVFTSGWLLWEGRDLCSPLTRSDTGP